VVSGVLKIAGDTEFGGVRFTVNMLLLLLSLKLSSSFFSHFLGFPFGTIAVLGIRMIRTVLKQKGNDCFGGNLMKGMQPGTAAFTVSMA
jgi:hypothetical protein